MNRHWEQIWLRGIGALKADANNMYLGMLWWVLEPMLLVAVFYLAFASGIRGGGDGNFVYFLLTGMLPFKWTASCISGGANALSANKGIIGQVYLPKWVFPTTVNLSMALRFLFVLPLMISLVMYGGYQPDLVWMSLISVVLCQLFFNLGISYVTSSLVPLIPDLNYVVPIAILALMFTSGIFYDVSDRPENIEAILRLNPFVQILDAYRAVLLHNQPVSHLDLAYAWICALVFILAGLLILKCLDRYYARLLQ